MSYCSFFIFLSDLSVNLKTNFGKTNWDRSLIFVTLDDQYRVKDAHAIFWRKYAPITTYDKYKTDY